jgi:selenide,water dikinase
VGIETSDDAGVYYMDGDLALVQTIDVITPVVDDPSDFGFIAAVNALSDIYAMGAKPMTALTFLAFDPCDLPLDIASLILQGGLRALRENGCTVVGGHTVEDTEIKFGAAVTGTVHPERAVLNSEAGNGDLIYITKPLGTGIIATALKGELLSPGTGDEFINWMKRSNGPAADAMVETGVSAATDVTGFGLLGHLHEMCAGSGLGAVLDISSIPLFAQVREMVDSGMVPAGAYRNRDHLEGKVAFSPDDAEKLWPFFDPQTSGGLLLAVPPDRVDSLENSLYERDVPVHRIGAFRSDPGIEIICES